MDKRDQLFILNILREGTIRWSGRSEAMRRSSRKVFEGKISKKGAELQKLYWQCNHCKEWKRDSSELEVDHIVEVGSFTTWSEYIPRLFCGQENLQVLCVRCHRIKTSKSNSTLRFERKKNVAEIEG